MGTKPAANAADAGGARAFRQAVILAVQNTHYEGLNQTIRFDANGDVSGAVPIYQLGASGAVLVQH